MGAAEAQDFDFDESLEAGDPGDPRDSSGEAGGDSGRTRALVIAPDAVVVRRDGRVHAAVALIAGAVGAAYLVRSLSGGSALDWALTGLMAAIFAGYAAGLADSRTPLLVADPHGVRIRLGRTWRGLTWASLERVEHDPRGRLRDGRLLFVSRTPHHVVDELTGAARRQARWSERLYGEPLAVPLGLATRVSHHPDELTAALQELAGGRALVVEALPAELLVDVDSDDSDGTDDTVGTVDSDTVGDTDHHDAGPAEGAERPAGRWRRLVHDPRPALAGTIEQLAASSTPAPLRETVSGRRAEVTVDLNRAADDDEALDHDVRQPGELRRAGSVSLVEDTQAWGDRELFAETPVHLVAPTGDPVETLQVDDDAPEPAPDPVVGPELAAARTRLGLSVDQLAERTRIRPHVIEAIEVDDFARCGGDFYARGHLRTLARVLGLDAPPLLAAYEERYSQAPVDPRRVFQVELASGGSIRSTRGGPNWSVLVAAVMALVLAWSIARLIMDSPVEQKLAPALNGSAGPGHGNRAAGPTVPVLVRAAGGGAHLVVRDGTGKIVYTGDLAYGQTASLEVSPPIQVETSDGSVEVVVDGSERGAVGETGQEATETYVVRG
ncbi:helix-turn-helix transcriptional regulator [Nocardioides bigeumensis]|uniref:Helix-turn-helix domain-containing protein n=1 Tax=Nocardioides bigeumensis TaxID=433657 RepID=A0ABN2XMP4_9ACTN